MTPAGDAPATPDSATDRPAAAPAETPDLLAATEALLAAATAEAVLRALAEAVAGLGYAGVAVLQPPGPPDPADPEPTKPRLRVTPCLPFLPPGPGPAAATLAAALAALPPGMLTDPGDGILTLPGLASARLVALSPTPSAQSAALAFIADRRHAPRAHASWDRDGRVLRVLATLAGLCRARLAATAPGPLRPRQREILVRVARGDTTARVAADLHLSRGAVEKHLRLAREAFGARTTVEAIAAALRLGLISTDG